MRKTLPALIAHCAVILALIILMGVLGLIASGVVAEGREKFTGELERGATLRILENDVAKEQGYFKELLDSFNEKYAEYGIRAVDANMDNFTDLETAGPFGYGPDVVYNANDVIMKYVDNTRKHILPLPVEKMECYKFIGENAWKAYEVEVGAQDYVCGVPVNIQQPLLYYRKDLLPENWEKDWDADKNGVPDMIENWNDLFRFSKQIRAESNGSKYGYMKSLNDGYFASGYFFSYGGYVFGGEDGKDTSDVGFSKNEGYKGAKIIRQLASVMNLECTEDTITTNAYSRMAQGTYFATMTTPDVYTMFVKEMMNAGYSEEYARENIVMTDIPKLPVSGDLEDASLGFKDMTVMGGVNGYAISSYTKAPNAALAFVDYATSYAMIERRAQLLGIAPARSDLAEKAGELNMAIYDNLAEGSIYVMPSIRALAQVWTPLQTYCARLADDVLTGKNAYVTDEALKSGIEAVDKRIYDAIHTLGGG